jgi:NAD-dependent DNA ligase
MEAVTVLEAIDLSIGRSGAIIPTAKLKVAVS